MTKSCLYKSGHAGLSVKDGRLKNTLITNDNLELVEILKLPPSKNKIFNGRGNLILKSCINLKLWNLFLAKLSLIEISFKIKN